ncbi:MAG: PH domain-containing protein [Planctomycetaceae bacterium]|nr:PH domain-containing protein [Planctomycetaceae bacterium]
MSDANTPSPANSSATAKAPDAASAKEKMMNSAGGHSTADEQELWRGDYSMKAMAGVGAGLVLLSIVAIVMGVVAGAGSTGWMVILGVVAVSWLAYFAVSVYRKFSFHYELTTHRLKHREGFLFRSMDRIELIDVSDVVLKMGPIQSLMNVGNIHVVSSDVSHPLLVMWGIPNARKVADLVDNARREERRKRGLHVHSI